MEKMQEIQEMEKIIVRRTARQAGEYDAVVCGGGTAGFAAAVSAARAGMKTALVERLGFFGGTATAGLVVPVSGFYHNGKRVVGGIGWELIRRLEADNAALVELPKGHVTVNPEYMKLHMQRMLLESGVELYTNTILTDCVTAGEMIGYAVTESKSGAEILRGKCFIDATGDGDLCHMAGAPMMPAEAELQPMSLCFMLTGVDLTTDLMRDCIHHNGLNSPHSCNNEIRQYLLSRTDASVQFGGPWFNSLLCGGCIAVNVTRRSGDAADRASVTEAEMRLREDMFTIVNLLKERYTEFAESVIASSAVNAGVRESRHILGVDTVTGEDMRSGRRYPCPVAHCAHPMDIHSASDSGQRLIPLEDQAYVPHTAMIPRNVKNLLAAGRCISADREAYASLRVQATMMSIGEAAGVMAAFCCERGGSMEGLPEKELADRFAARGFVV